jgi:hypothetical protein
MKAEAWATLCEGASSYSAIGSAYFFARPALRLNGVRATLALLEDAENHEDEEVVRLAKELRDLTRDRLTASLGREIRWNALGLFFLLLSATLLAVAIFIHIHM